MPSKSAGDYVLTSTFTIEEPLPTPKKRRQYLEMRGWRISVTLGTVAALLVLIANIALIIWAAQNTTEPVQNGIITLFRGSCERTKTISTWSHLPINILSTILLAASNVGMQCLIAPTREDIDNAHRRGTWLHVGVFGLRNALYIPRSRVIAVAILALSSVPLHLL